MTLGVDDELVELLIATAFAEVWLAKQGHNGVIFINFLNKVELPLLFSMYGAMLAGVDDMVVGAGNHLGGVRRLSRQGYCPFWAKDVVDDILLPFQE